MVLPVKEKCIVCKEEDGALAGGSQSSAAQPYLRHGEVYRSGSSDLVHVCLSACRGKVDHLEIETNRDAGLGKQQRSNRRTS